jgi:UDP-2,4-diacetamido-2,4,6-trideoxy-beta-L-altropyranose hydrolase
MLRIVIRCDASVQIGSGHVMRCLTLANALREKGADITFVCRKHPGDLFDLIESSNHRLVRLSPPVEDVGGDLAHAHWLGATQKEDARQTAEALKAIGHLDWLIIDHYALDVKWETAMCRYAKRIMVIDDLADRKHDCDVLLDQNLHQDMQERYDDLVPPSCTKLLGPKYALLRSEFKEARKNLRTRDGSVKRIFVFFGGSDPTNETGKTLRAIQQLGSADIAIDVVVGATNPHQEDIAKLCRQLPEAKLYRQVNNIAELMAKTDLAIGAGGGAMWERCCLGLPAIVMSVANNQQSGCDAVARSGGILYLGEAKSVGIDLLKGALRVALSSSYLLASMSEVGASLVDGQGSNRVAKRLMASSIMLRQADLADCESIFNWRNAEETRQFSSGTNLITLDEHVAWFRKALENPERLILIGESNGEAVGVLRFDRDEKCAVISVYLVPGNYGKGIGVQLIEQGVSWVEHNWPKVASIEATIMAENSPSISVFSEAGFKKKSYTYVRHIRN